MFNETANGIKPAEKLRRVFDVAQLNKLSNPAARNMFRSVFYRIRNFQPDVEFPAQLGKKAVGSFSIAAKLKVVSLDDDCGS